MIANGAGDTLGAFHVGDGGGPQSAEFVAEDELVQSENIYYAWLRVEVFYQFGKGLG